MAFAFSRSICTSCCGSLAVKLVKRPRRSWRWRLRADDFVRDGVEVLQRIAAQILQFELESAETADAVDGGRFESHHDGPRNAEKLGRDACHDFAAAWPLPSRSAIGFSGAKISP